MVDMEERKRKRYKSSGDSSFNTRESGEGNINLNNMVGDEEDEMEEVRRGRPMGRDQAKKKEKAGMSSASSTTSFDVEKLTKLMAIEHAMASDPYNAKKDKGVSVYHLVEEVHLMFQKKKRLGDKRKPKEADAKALNKIKIS
ncbi:hypothetical protein Tco_0083867 [Tanacetum coccineum]